MAPIFAPIAAALAGTLFTQHQSKISLLITDVIMPGTSGPQLFAHLAKECPALTVLYVSGYSGDLIEQHGQLVPEIAFPHKPFTAAALNQWVRSVLDR